MSGLFEGRVVVIAGGAWGGIGGSTAQRIAEQGGSVVVGDVNITNGQRTADQIVADGGKAIAVQFDISDEASVNDLFAAATREFGHVDGLVNNAADVSAGTLGVDDASDAVTVPLDVWHRTFAVDLTGFLLTIRAAIPLMLEHGGGSIVNVSSEASVLGLADKVAYSSAKAGVNALTRHVARRWGLEGIRCNAVCPGMVMTERAKAMYGADAYGSEDGNRRRGVNPLGRVGEPEDLAAAVTYLLSDEAGWVTGQVHHVSGGMFFAH